MFPMGYVRHSLVQSFLIALGAFASPILNIFILCIFSEYDLRARYPLNSKKRIRDGRGDRVWCHSIFAYLRT